jgi:hypothetical protein
LHVVAFEARHYAGLGVHVSYLGVSFAGGPAVRCIVEPRRRIIVSAAPERSVRAGGCIVVR